MTENDAEYSYMIIDSLSRLVQETPANNRIQTLHRQKL